MKKRFKRLITVVLMLTVFALVPCTLAAKVTSKDDMTVFEEKRKEFYTQYIEQLFEPWPQILETVGNRRNPFVGFNSIKQSPEFQIYLEHNRTFIEWLYNKLFDEDEESLAEKFGSLLVYHPKFDDKYKQQELDRIYRSYQDYQGCDCINAILRGDISTYESDPPRPAKSPATWGTPLVIHPECALTYAKDALALKEDLSRSPLDAMTLYRGTCLPKVLDSVGNIRQSDCAIVENALSGLREGAEVAFPSGVIIYRAKDISSCSKNRETAKYYANRVYEKSGAVPVVLEIDIKKGTAFGKDFRRRDTNEVILKPGQKLRLISATKEDGCIYIRCETTI